MSQLKSNRTLPVLQEINLFHRKRPRARWPRHDLSVSESHSNTFYSWTAERQTFYVKHWKAFITHIHSYFVFLDFSDFVLFHKIHEIKIKNVIIKNHQNWQYFTLFFILFPEADREAHCLLWPQIPKLNQNKTYTQKEEVEDSGKLILSPAQINKSEKQSNYWNWCHINWKTDWAHTIALHQIHRSKLSVSHLLLCNLSNSELHSLFPNVSQIYQHVRDQFFAFSTKVSYW